MIETAPVIFTLTGAGISAESGIKTFRDNNGLWETHRVEDVATPEAFSRDPVLVHRFYNLRRTALMDAQPNPAHVALARLQTRLRERGGDLIIVTQNVDDLHERGGAKDVIHMHGELRRALCSICGSQWRCDGELSCETVCPSCGDVGSPRPDIVWFGEIPYHMDRIEAALVRADQFISIGTSGAVYPAAGFVQMMRSMRTPTLELNMEPSQGSTYFDAARYGPAGTIVPGWADNVLSA